MKFVVTKQIKEKWGKGADNAKGSCQDPKTSVVIHAILFIFLFCVYCLYGYLSRKFSSAKEITNRSERDFLFGKSVLAKIL